MSVHTVRTIVQHAIRLDPAERFDYKSPWVDHGTLVDEVHAVTHDGVLQPSVNLHGHQRRRDGTLGTVGYVDPVWPPYPPAVLAVLEKHGVSS